MSHSKDADEASLLASVGGTVKDMANYEENVVLQAQLDSAPKLTGHGFPDLHALAPSFSARAKQRGNNNAADLPHFTSVLSKARLELKSLDHDESHRSQVLRLKIEMILVYLEQYANLPKEDLPISLPRELAAEHVRKRSIQNGATQQQQQAPAFEGDSKPTAKRRKNDNDLPDTDNMTREQRLQIILKNGEDVKPQRKRARKTLQEWKQQRLLKGAPSLDKEELEETRQYLKERRKERQERRRKRLALLLGVDKDNEEDEEAEFEEDGKLSSSYRPKTKDVKSAVDTSAKVIAEDASNPTAAEGDSVLMETDAHVTGKQPLENDNSILQDDSKVAMELEVSEVGVKMKNPEQQPPGTVQTPRYVECPVCHDQIQYSSDPDSVLSQHIDGCQHSSGRRRSTRTRSIKSYAEEECFSEDPYQEDCKPHPRATRSASKVMFAMALAPKKKATVVVPVKPIASAALDDLEEWVYEDRVDEWIESGLSRMKVMAERDQQEMPPGAVVYEGNLRIPAWVNNRLFSYQRTGLRWMWELHRQEAGGIVGDEMGLGKTVQICSFLGSMAASRKLRSILIVCPATVLQHWLKELSIWAPGLRRVLIHKSGETDGASRNISSQLLKAMSAWLKTSRADRLYEPIDESDFEERDIDSFVGTGYVFVTTYENVRRAPDVWTTHKWSYVVLDEGQKIRNPDADVTLVCKRLRTPHRLLLSGTPIQNDLKELWTLFDFVFPGRLGTLPAFENEFAEPIKRGGFSNASPMQVQLAYRCALVLKDLINPYLLRRQKKDIKEVSRMPGKTEQVLFCRLSKRQRELYEAYLRSDEVINILRGSPQLFRSITILRKISNHPDLVCDPSEAAYENFVRNGYNQIPDTIDSDDECDDDAKFTGIDSLVDRSGKLEVLAKILPLWRKQGHRVLIFCQWTKMLNILQQFMMVKGWKFGRMDGKTSVASRQRLVDTFNVDESYFALLMTTRTGGVGLNLTGADRVVIYDPDWNPQTDSQARARSHRFGQTKPVTIYRLITAGTIEEKIYHRQIFKTALTNRVLQDPKQKRLFSQRDLRDFFTLKADDGSIIQGGSAVTELGAVTGGEGVINPEDVARGGGNDSDGHNDDKETLESVMKSKGLAGVFDHDFVNRSDAALKSTSILEMEARARKVAQDAAKALQASTAHSASVFEPTWTGSKETAGRFGHGNLHAKRDSSFRRRDGESNFGRAGVVASNESSGALSSKSLLAGLKGMGSSTKIDHDGEGEAVKYAELLKRIKSYIRHCGGFRPGGGPSTDDILVEFKSVPASDAAIFRRLLSSVAKVQRGKWSLKE